VTADPGETPAGTAGAGTADLTLDAKVAAADVPPAILAQSLGEYVRVWWLRVRSGNSGLLPVVLAIVVVAVVFEIITPEHAYLRPSNLVYIFGLSTVYMVLAMAETVVLLLAEVDLSVGAVALIGGVIAFKLVQQPGPNWPWWLAVLASLAICGAIGAVQGSLTALLRVPSFVATLAGFLLFSGVLVIVLGGADTTVSLNTSVENQNIIYEMVQGLIPPVVAWIILVVVVVAAAAPQPAMPDDVVRIVPSLELIMVLSPLAEVVVPVLVEDPLLFPLPVDVLVLLGDELPHAARPTTAAAARMGAANHRLRIVFSPFATVTRSAYIQEHVRPGRIVQTSSD